MQQLQSSSTKRLQAWRLCSERTLELVEILDAEVERDAGIPLRWYDVLVRLDETAEGVRMNELAGEALYSKSGFTRVVDRMEAARLVRRVRPENDRRSVLVVLTDRGRAVMKQARRHYEHAIEEHFSRNLSGTDIEALTRVFEKIGAQAKSSSR